jgi:hypothetical protein
MGQQIESEMGVSVSLELTYDNLSKIIGLFDIPNLRVYVSGYSDNLDEVIDVLYEEDSIDVNYDILDELSQCKDEEEYNSKYIEMELTEDITFHFVKVITGMYTNNLCYRKINRLFESVEETFTISDFIESIQKATETFKSHNIPDNLILIGHTMREG